MNIELEDDKVLGRSGFSSLGRSSKQLENKNDLECELKSE